MCQPIESTKIAAKASASTTGQSGQMPCATKAPIKSGVSEVPKPVNTFAKVTSRVARALNCDASSLTAEKLSPKPIPSALVSTSSKRYAACPCTATDATNAIRPKMFASTPIPSTPTMPRRRASAGVKSAARIAPSVKGRKSAPKALASIAYGAPAKSVASEGTSVKAKPCSIAAP